MKRIHVLLIVLILMSVFGIQRIKAQPLLLSRNSAYSDFYRGRDQTITYTQTQLAVRYHGNDEWQVRDMPYDTAKPIYDGTYVCHAAADTILVAQYIQYNPPGASLRIAVFRSTDGGRTWTEFFRHPAAGDSNNCVRYISGFVVVFYEDEQNVLHALSVDSNATVRSHHEFGAVRLVIPRWLLRSLYVLPKQWRIQDSRRYQRHHHGHSLADDGRRMDGGRSGPLLAR